MDLSLWLNNLRFLQVDHQFQQYCIVCLRGKKQVATRLPCLSSNFEIEINLLSTKSLIFVLMATLKFSLRKVSLARLSMQLKRFFYIFICYNLGAFICSRESTDERQFELRSSIRRLDVCSLRKEEIVVSLLFQSHNYSSQGMSVLDIRSRETMLLPPRVRDFRCFKGAPLMRPRMFGRQFHSEIVGHHLRRRICLTVFWLDILEKMNLSSSSLFLRDARLGIRSTKIPFLF